MNTTHQVPLVIEEWIIEAHIIVCIYARDCVFCGDALTAGVISLINGLVVEVSDWKLNLFVVDYGPLCTTQQLLLLGV